MSILKRIKRSLSVRGRRLLSAGKRRVLLFSRSLLQNRSGINLIGYFSYTSGVAEVGRFFARFTNEAAVPFVIYDVPAPGYKELDAVSLQTYLPHFSSTTRYHKNIFFINADQIPVLQQTAPYLFLGRYNAAVFFWEFNDYFHFPQAFNWIQEVIAFTDFIATAVSKAAPAQVRVTKLPFPFSRNWQITKSAGDVRKQRGIAAADFVFVFNFDFYSVYQRKNPEAILRAFELAFTPADNVRLILKTIHGGPGAPNYDDFLQAVEKMRLKEKLLVINENLERNELMNIIHASDCYVSLHRSEGLGLGMLEAMSMARPVIATNFGGNTDFTNSENALVVDYTLVPVQAGAGPYQAGWLWAEADVEQAAGYMQKLYLDRSFAQELGLRAQRSVELQYSYEVFRESLQQWMNR